MADTYVGGDSPVEWNLEGFSSALRAMGLEGEATSEAALDEVAANRETLVEYVRDLVDERLEAREQEHGEEVWSQVERFVLLRTIDSLWVEHLTEIDDMRRGIGLRGYAQQDPLNEFRKEAFRLYEELGDLIRRQVATTIFRVTVKREPPPGTVPLPGPGQPPLGGGDGHDHGHADGGSVSSGSTSATASGPMARGPMEPGGAALRNPGTGTGTGPGGGSPLPLRGLPADPMRTARQVPGDAAASGQARPGLTPTGTKIGRNDPCWCGSGQKYKKCHGA